MRKEYGYGIPEPCEYCCNYQLGSRETGRMVCIAYSMEEDWDKKELACGLFNRPFRGIRPRMTPLLECKYQKTCQDHVDNPDQQSLFLPTTA